MEFWMLIGVIAAVSAIPGALVLAYYMGKRRGLLIAFNYYRDTLDDMERTIRSLAVVREHYDKQ